jgi:nitronate monooxygenase
MIAGRRRNRRPIHIPMEPMIADWLSHHARTRGDQLAAIDLGTSRRFTNGRFFERVTRLAGALRARHGVGPGDPYLGTRFIAAAESRAGDEYKRMLVGSTEEDIILSAHFTGVPAHYLRPSIVRAGLAPEALGVRAEKKFDHRGKTAETEAWRDIWAAGPGVGAIKRVQTAAEIVADLKADYRAARSAP